jgi:hypothetical protein
MVPKSPTPEKLNKGVLPKDIKGVFFKRYLWI